MDPPLPITLDRKGTPPLKGNRMGPVAIEVVNGETPPTQRESVPLSTSRRICKRVSMFKFKPQGEFSATMADFIPKRGDIWIVDFGDETTSFGIQHGIRPCVIISNDVSNANASSLIVAQMTLQESHLPYFVRTTEKDGVDKIGYINCANITTIGTSELLRKFGQLSDETVERVNQSLRSHLELE